MLPQPTFVQFTDNACDLSPEVCAEYDVHRIMIQFRIEDPKDPSRNLIEDPDDVDEFYSKLSDDNLPKTAAANSAQFIEKFTPFLDAGLDILYFGLMKGLSATIDAAQMAAKELSEKYPERRIVCLDSRCVSGGLGYLVMKVAKMRLAGTSLDEIIDYIENNKMSIIHDFTIDKLNFLRAGGRISRASQFFGELLGICPVMHVDYTTGDDKDWDRDEMKDRLVLRTKVRGKRLALKAMADRIFENIKRDDEGNPIGFILVAYGDCHEKAEEFIKLLQAPERFDNRIEIMVTRIAGVIGSHVGGTVLHPSYEGYER